MSTTVRTSATASIAVPAVSEARARCARTVRASDALVPVRYGRKCRSPVERAAAEAVIERRFCVIEPLLGTKTACVATGLSRATHYRSLTPQRPRSKAPRPSPPNKPTEGEATGVLEALRSQRVVDFSPTEAYFTLLDEGTCLGSCSTYYRLLRAHGELHERRRQRRTPTRAHGRETHLRMKLGHHEAQGPKTWRRLRPLRRARHLQPLCRRVGGGPLRVRTLGRRTHRRRRRPTPRRARPAVGARGSGQFDDIEPGDLALRLLRERPQPLTDPR